MTGARSAAVSYGGVVTETEGPAATHPGTAELLELVKQLREAAARAGRCAVVARTDDLVLLIADGTAPGERDQRGVSRSDTVLRILNGLGF